LDLPEESEEIDSDSPWTIEAIDGEEDEERDEVHFLSISSLSVVDHAFNSLPKSSPFHE
jgi:hypothetical protein